jgi:hypothetical protein
MAPTKSKSSTRQQVSNGDIRALTSKLANLEAAVKANKPRRARTMLGDIGRNAGEWAGDAVSKIFGMGSYTLRRNSLWKSGRQVPVMHSANEKVTMRHREFVANVVSSDDFDINTIDLNPGLDGTFPYLSAIASNFQEYQFKGLVVAYHSTSTDVVTTATSAAIGTVMLSANYRADADPPSTKLALLNQMWTTDCKPSEDCILPVECSPRENPLAIFYTRSGPLAANSDKKLYDLCSISIATEGNTYTDPGTKIGELWISYEVEFFKPVLSSGPIDSLSGADVFTLTAPSAALPLGVPTRVISTLGCTVSVNRLYLPDLFSGYIQFTYYVTGTTPAVVTYPALTYTNCSAALPQYVAAALDGPPGATNSASRLRVFYVYASANYIGQASYIDFGTAGVFPTGSPSGILTAEQVPEAIF